MELYKCEHEDCSRLAVCHVCDTCAEHCNTQGGPDRCWEAHESWRWGLGDPTFGADAHCAVPMKRRTKPICPAAPQPSWRS